MRSDIDPLILEIVRNSFSMAADEMALILMRSAHSMIVRDSMDYSTAVCDRHGQIVGQGLTTPMHLGSFYDAMQQLIRQYEGRITPGDVFVGNDPYLAAGQHLPDIYVIKPIFVDGRLSGWATSIAHHADVGGMVAGSNSIGAHEIFQEGLRLPFLKLYEAGQENTAILEILSANVRVPDKVLGDLRAQLAACDAGERAYAEIYAHFGHAEMELFTESLHDHAEELARVQFREIPDGVYSFTDHIDGLGEDPQPITFHVTLTVDGDEIVADWTGTDPQVAGGINAPLSFLKSNVYAALRSIMQGDVPNCHGFTRPITVVAPLGTIVNAEFPAACGARGITGYRVVDCLFGALAKAVPDLITADGTGGSTLPTIAGWRAKNPFVFSECVMGVWGASREADGQSGVPHMASNQSNVPIEMIEAEYPLRIERYGYLPDTGGPGRRRGGVSILREYRALEDGLTLSVRSDKRAFPPHGLEGGGVGAPCVNRLIRNGAARDLPTLFLEPVAFDRNDLFHHVMAGGGGFGDPLRRAPALVLQDIEDGFVTPDGARQDYGVVLNAAGNAVEPDATARLRADIEKARDAAAG